MDSSGAGGGGGGRVYTVSDSRLPVYCTYSSRPDNFNQTSSSSSPLRASSTSSYLPASSQSRMIQCPTSDPFISNQRLMVLPPRIRNVYAGLDLDDDDEDPEDAYVSPTINRPASQRVDSYLDDIINSPEMSEIESETRKIRRDAEAVLARLGESSKKKKPARLSSVYFPDLSYTSSTCSSPYVPKTSSSSSSYTPYSSSLTSSYYYPERTRVERAVTPEHDDFYSRPRRPLSYSSSLSGVSRPLKHDPIAQVQAEINRKSLYSENCRKINDSIKTNWTPKKKKEKYYPDADEVKNNINFKAQYAATRAAASVGVRKNNDYLMV